MNVTCSHHRLLTVANTLETLRLAALFSHSIRYKTPKIYGNCACVKVIRAAVNAEIGILTQRRIR